MHYEFTYRNTPGDYWRFYMSNIYHQWTAVVNVIFTAAALALIVTRFRGAHPVLQVLMLLLLCLFPVFQPLVIWLRAVRQARAIRVDTTILMDDGGFGILVQSHRQRILWREFRGVMRRAGLTVLLPDEVHAYLLPDRVTGAQGGDVYRDVRAALDRYQKEKV